MKYFSLKLILFTLLFNLVFISNLLSAQSDTVQVQQATVLPTIDGIGNDPCWDAPGVKWEPIDQVWMPWKGTNPTSADFTGKYKIIWDKTTNLLYYLVDVTDDVFVDGYNFAVNGPYGYPSYDVVEIFIDENRSKGPHVFDNGTENAQNAFSYHINVNAPADNDATNVYTVEDLDGTTWSNSWVVNYAAHFPEFMMRKSGNNYLYEFSMKVYTDTYPTQQKSGYTATDIEKARVSLTAGKIMGMTMAYCDNDANDGKRDHFFGSTPGKEYTGNFGYNGTKNSISDENGQKIFNTCWMSAGDYGVIKLMDKNQAPTFSAKDLLKEKVSIVPVNNDLNWRIHIASTAKGTVKVEIFNLLGSKVVEISGRKTSNEFNETIDVSNLLRGVYFARIRVSDQIIIKKILKQ